MTSEYLLIGLGGALGAIFRVFLSNILPYSAFNIPIYIMLINIIGCFFMGAISELLGLYWSTSLNMKYFLISGLLGGFTTFSAFALEFGLLIEKGQYLESALYILLSVMLSLMAFFIGLKIIKLMF